MLPLLAVLATIAITPAANASTPIFNFDGPEPMQNWRPKVNVQIDTVDAEPHSPPAALRAQFDTQRFRFGWFRHPVPKPQMADIAGFSFFYRAPKGARGNITFRLVHPQGNDRTVYSADIGPLIHSRGKWLQAYVALTDLELVHGPALPLKPHTLGPDWLMLFMIHRINDETVVDIDSVSWVTKDEAEPIAKRVAAEQRRRLLIPGAELELQHPRLLLTPDRVKILRRKADAGGHTRKMWDRLIELANTNMEAIDPADPFGDIVALREEGELHGDPLTLAHASRVRHQSAQIELLAAAYQLTGNEEYGRHAAEALANATQQIGPEDPIMTAGRRRMLKSFYLRSIALAYDWVCELLSPEQRMTIKSTIIGYITTIHNESLSAGWGSRLLHRVWNWDPGIMSALGLGVMAVKGETRLAEKAILAEARQHVYDYLIMGIDFDGCGHEGPGYFAYAMDSGTFFIEALRQHGLGDAFVDTNYELIPKWLVAETLPGGGRWNNLSDCSPQQSPAPAFTYACGRLAKLAARHSEPDPGTWLSPSMVQPLTYLQHFRETQGPRKLSYKALAGLMGWVWQKGPGQKQPGQYRNADALAHVLFYHPCRSIDDPASVLPLGTHFRGRGLAVSRSGFEADDIHLAVEAGPHAAGHDQCDKGTFTFRAYGADLAIDSGYGNDGDPRGSTSSHAHNVVLIDGEGQPMGHHNRSDGYITGYLHSDLLDWVRVDAKPAWSMTYGRNWRPTGTTPVKRADRHIMFVRGNNDAPPYLIVYDDIVKDTDTHEYTWQWHIPSTMRFHTENTPWRAKAWSATFDVLVAPRGSETGAAEFTFTVPEDGKYVIYGLTRAAGHEPGKSDSFFATIDDGERMTWDTGAHDTFGWRAVGDRGEDEAHVFDFKHGKHLLLLDKRESQTQLARIAVLPADTAPPTGPEPPKSAVTALEANEATVTGDITLTTVTIEAPTSTTMECIPVHPTDGSVSSDWFTTTGEGSHPRLQYDVTAVEPQFVLLLIPRTEDTPRPSVTRLNSDNGYGAAIEWPQATDRVLFTRRNASAGPLTIHASAAFVRTRKDTIQAWGIFDGTNLTFNDTQLHEAPQPTARIGNHNRGQ